MLNFSVYKGKELQNFLSMLNQCETEGVTDIRFVRERLYTHINKTLLDSRIKDVKDRRASGRYSRRLKKEVKTCPSCGKRGLYPVKNSEGITIVGCNKCRYSEIIEGN